MLNTLTHIHLMRRHYFVGIPGVRNVVHYDCCPDNPYIDITYSIQIRRRKLYYIVNIVSPCLMLATLTLVTFTIPPDAGEKISFGELVRIIVELVLLINLNKLILTLTLSTYQH